MYSHVTISWHGDVEQQDSTVRTGAPASARVVGARHGAVEDFLPVLAEPRVALVVAHRQRREIAVKLCRQTGHKYTSLGTNT